MKRELSKVFLDGYPVPLMADEAKLPVSRIVRASGERPGRVGVVLLKSASDPNGKAVDPEAIIDRAATPTEPIYLRSYAKLADAAGQPGSPAATVAAPQAAATPAQPNVDRVIAQLGVEPRQDPRRQHDGELGGLAPEVTPVFLKSRAGREASEDREQEGALHDEEDAGAEAEADDERTGE